MRPESIGRVLGIGVRVAGRVAGQRLSPQHLAPISAADPDPGRPPGSGSDPGSVQPAPVSRDAVRRGRAAGRASRGVARGISGFLRPFRRVGGILWLEITGVFFLLPVAAFGPTIWRTRASLLGGPDQRTFWASVLVVAVFLYLSLTSFGRARRR